MMPFTYFILLETYTHRAMLIIHIIERPHRLAYGPFSTQQVIPSQDLQMRCFDAWLGS